MAGIKNADGTVNFEGMKNHLNYVKGKYAQNAENYKKNTGHEMSFGDATTATHADAATSTGHDDDVKERATADASTQANDDAPDAALRDQRKQD